MKADPKIVDALNALLAEELTAVNQYMVHAEMCESWGYHKLHKNIRARAFTEMRHAEKLIERLLFLEARPNVSDYRPMSIAEDVPKMLVNDLGLEMGAVKHYNDVIVLCGELRDYATRELLEKILKDEDEHVDEIEERQDQIAQMGLPMFLGMQTSTES